MIITVLLHLNSVENLNKLRKTSLQVFPSVFDLKRFYEGGGAYDSNLDVASSKDKTFKLVLKFTSIRLKKNPVC